METHKSKLVLTSSDHHHNTVFLVVLTKFSFCLSFTHFVFKSWQVLSAEFELGLQAMIENVHFKIKNVSK